jgi:ankyrin repeat protein
MFVLNTRDEHYQMPMLLAEESEASRTPERLTQSRRANRDVVSLLEKQANIYAANDRGWTPLLLAAKNGTGL